MTVEGHGRARPSHLTLKVIMAVTGTILALFVLVHMIGNLKVFMGPAEYDAYARFLRTLLHPLFPYEGVLWCVRVVLGVCLVLHVWAGITVWWRGRRARGAHRRRNLRALSYGARTMILSGAVVLAFVVVHLLDLTLGMGVESASYRAPERIGQADVRVHAYANLVASLSRPPMAIFYCLVMLVIAAHIAQGAWNVINDLGGTGRRLRRIWLLVGLLIALAIAVGNGMLPILILTGVIS